MNAHIKLVSLIILIASLGVHSGCKPVATSSSPPLLVNARERKPCPVWSLQDFQGKTVSSADYLGKVVILDFWATWCPPCREEIPGLVALQEKYRDQGLVILGVDVGPEPGAVVEKFASRMKINYPLLMGSAEVDRAFGGVESIPTTIIIDRHGQIASRHVGLTSRPVFEKEIQPLLNEK